MVTSGLPACGTRGKGQKVLEEGPGREEIGYPGWGVRP